MKNLISYIETVPKPAAHIDEIETAKIEAIDCSRVKPRCEAFDITRPCGAEGVMDYVTTEGRVRKLCKVHYYKLMCLRKWNEERKQKQDQEAESA